jgi:hypothetical protein
VSGLFARHHDRFRAWACGFYLGTEPGEHSLAVTSGEAHTASELAWQALTASRDLGPAFKAWRDHRDWIARKSAMWRARGEAAL